MRASLLITFTPVATAYLPAVLNEQTPVPAPTLTPEPLIPDVQLSHIEYNPPGLDSEGEYVDIRSFETDSVDMTGWTLRDEVNTVFTFPAFTLAGQASVRIWIRSGSNDAGNLYWGRNSATWNNDGDTATLRNSSGQQVDQCSYSGGGEDVDC
jgi:hypothetical protein